MKELHSHPQYRVRQIKLSSSKKTRESLSSLLFTRGFTSPTPQSSMAALCDGAVPKNGEIILLTMDASKSHWFKVDRQNGTQVFAGPAPRVSSERDRMIVTGRMSGAEIECIIECDAREYKVVDPSPVERKSTVNAPKIQSDKGVSILSSKRKHLTVLVSDIMPFPGQPRIDFDEADLKGLSEGMLSIGQQQPCIVIPAPPGSQAPYILIDGERRWRAAKLVSATHIEVIVDGGQISPSDHFKKSYVSNSNRVPHNLRENCRAVDLIIRGGTSFAELAKQSNQSESWLRRVHSLTKLHPELMTLLGPPTPTNEQLVLQDAELLIKLPESEQIELYRKLKTRANNGRQFRHYLAREIDAVTRVNASRQTMRSRARSMVRFSERLDEEILRYTADVDMIAEYMSENNTNTMTDGMIALLRRNADGVKVLAERLEEALRQHASKKRQQERSVLLFGDGTAERAEAVTEQTGI